MIDPPAQTHSETSVESSRSLSRKRLMSQERWIYQVLRRSDSGMSDWELWDKARFIGSIFDQKSSCRRARIGLYWRNKHEHARHGSPWHPVEDSGRKNKDPGSNKATVIWKIKDRYKDMPYDDWAHDYRNLAKGSIEEPLAEV